MKEKFYDLAFTPQKLVDENFNTVWQGDYFAFGSINETVNTVENNLRFPGQYYDSETGFYYNFHRYYVPDIGRYLREDPVRNGLNYYLYVKDNPVLMMDFNGLGPWDIISKIGKYASSAGEAVSGALCFGCLDKLGDCAKKCREKWNKCKERNKKKCGIGKGDPTLMCLEEWKRRYGISTNSAYDDIKVKWRCAIVCLGREEGCGICASFLGKFPFLAIFFGL